VKGSESSTTFDSSQSSTLEVQVQNLPSRFAHQYFCWEWPSASRSGSCSKYWAGTPPRHGPRRWGFRGSWAWLGYLSAFVLAPTRRGRRTVTILGLHWTCFWALWRPSRGRRTPCVRRRSLVWVRSSPSAEHLVGLGLLSFFQENLNYSSQNWGSPR